MVIKLINEWHDKPKRCKQCGGEYFGARCPCR